MKSSLNEDNLRDMAISNHMLSIFMRTVSTKVVHRGYGNSNQEHSEHMLEMRSCFIKSGPATRKHVYAEDFTRIVYIISTPCFPWRDGIKIPSLSCEGHFV